MKFTMTKTVAALVLAAAATGAQAVAVSSLTVLEIGSVTGMTMASASASNSVAGEPFVGESGGIFYFGLSLGDGVMPGSGGKIWGTTDTPNNFFNPPSGMTDGQITMGVVQIPGQMSDGFNYGGPYVFAPHSLNGALSGSWSGVDGVNTLSLNLAGFGAFWSAFDVGSFNMSPDEGTLHTNVQTIDGVHYYTADWVHIITEAENPDAAGQRGNWHMEGVMRPVPEASTYGMMLVGLGLVGAIIRRSKRRV